MSATMVSRELARECLEAHQWDWSAAEEEFHKRIDSDKSLAEQVARELFFPAIHALVREVGAEPRRMRARQDYIKKGAEAQERATTRFQAWSAKQSMYDFPLWGGKRLGDCTREDLVESRERYVSQANGINREIRWHDAILEKLRGRKSVREQIKEDKLRELREQIVGGGTE